MIHFVGAGPGGVDLITVRGQRLLQEADCIIFAGSLVNPILLDYAKEGCASSVENSESCIFNDRCDVLITKYVHPRWTEYCPKCGQKTFAEMTGNSNPSLDEIYCINCGYRTTKGEYWMHH